MALIHVPRPRNAMNPRRPVNALLKAQMLHLHDAEMKLPVRHRTDIYINAIKTEGEAGEYIRQVTEAIHAAHADAAEKRARPAKRKRVIEIAAVADDTPVRQRTSVARNKAKKKAKTKLGRKA